MTHDAILLQGRCCQSAFLQLDLCRTRVSSGVLLCGAAGEDVYFTLYDIRVILFLFCAWFTPGLPPMRS